MAPPDMPLASLIGHRAIVTLLREAVVRDRVPQSLLFAGPDGVGKRTAAVALAQAINCSRRGTAEGPADDACGVCPACQRIARGQHFDVVELGTDGAASIKIEPLRERVLAAVGYRPFEARKRVFIIDPADALTVQAQDALLKTLEEPPSSSILVLVTSQPDTLLATVQSRCRRLRFGILSEADVARVLVAGHKMPPAEARVAAALSGGSVARALSESSGEAVADRDAALELLAAAASSSGPVARLKVAAALAKHGSGRRDRAALAARLAVVGSLLRDVAAIASGARGAVEHVDVDADLARFAEAYNSPRLLAAWAALDRATDALDRNASPKIVADWISLAL